MKSKINLLKLKRSHGRFIRGLAVFFLLFTGADLFMPQYFCAAEEVAGIRLDTSQKVSYTVKADAPRLATTFELDKSQPDQPQDKEHHEDDCFCCCAHILPGMRFGGPVAFDLISLPAPPTVNSLPSPPLQGTYHPPRFA